MNLAVKTLIPILENQNVKRLRFDDFESKKFMPLNSQKLDRVLDSDKISLPARRCKINATFSKIA